MVKICAVYQIDELYQIEHSIVNAKDIMDGTF